MLTFARPSVEPFGAPTTHAQRIGRAAIAALYDELALAPKPGLVSFEDTGSHSDMHAGLFMRSLFALRHYFIQIALLGGRHAPFAELQKAGVAAEARMLGATGGVNTHRGAVFLLGLLAASAGAACGPVSTACLRRLLVVHWGPELVERMLTGRESNGRRAARAHGLRGAMEEAALGFPAVFDLGSPVLRRALHAGMSVQRARLQTLMAVIAELDDTNLAHRGGAAGLRFAQARAREFLSAGGAARPDALAHARAIHRAFVSRRLSPGGAADVLAASCMLQRVCCTK